MLTSYSSIHQEVAILTHTWKDQTTVFQKIMKNTNVLEFISNLGYIVSANDDLIKNCEIYLFSESSEWKHLFEFEDMISDSVDSSHNDWLS